MKYGKDFASYLEAYELFKQDDPNYPIPPAIAERPDLEYFDQYYLDAFWVLTNSRSIGMAEGFIPLSEIINYGLYLQDDDMDKFITCISAMDREFVSIRAKESEKKGK